MKMAPHPALAHGKACHVGDPVAVGDRRQPRRPPRTRPSMCKIDYEVLPAVVDPAKAQASGAPQIHEVAPGNTIYQWHLGDKQATDAAFASAKHVATLDLVNNRLVPNAIEPRAAIAEYDAGSRQLHPVEHDAESARRAPRHRRLRRHGARAQAARDRARRRRRVRLEDLHLSRGGGGAVGVAAARPAGEMGGAAPESFLSDAHGRDHVTHAEMAFDENGKISRAARQARSPISAPTCRRSRRRCRPISTRRCCRASTTSRTSIARSMRSTPTRCRSTPIAAPAARRRPSWWSGWWRSAPARWASTRPTCASATSSRASRTRRRSSWPTTPATIRPRWTRRWSSSTTRGSASASAKRRATASCAASASPTISRRAASRRRRRSARSAAAWACGNPPRCG